MRIYSVTVRTEGGATVLRKGHLAAADPTAAADLGLLLASTKTELPLSELRVTVKGGDPDAAESLRRLVAARFARFATNPNGRE